MSTPIEAASLYATVGERGVDATISRLGAVGAVVDKLSKAETSVAVTETGADEVVSALENASGAAQALDGQSPEVTATANVAQAVSSLEHATAAAQALDVQNPEINVTANGGEALSMIERIRAAAMAIPNVITTRIQAIGGGIGSPAAAEKAGKLGAAANLVMNAGGFLPGMAGQVGMVGSQASMLGLSGGAMAATAGAAGIAIVGAMALKSAGQMETFRTQLSVLLGSEDAANERMKELVKFGATTPFELPEVVQASKTLQVFAGDTLATGDGLRMIGDVAAGTGSDFQETAMWFGRMYDALKSGRPFGEATQRLQEMGALSGQSRAKIEALAEGVKTGAVTMDQAWGTVAGEFGRFSGMMDKQSATLDGKFSNLQDSVGQLLAKIGDIILPPAKVIIDGLITIFTMFGQGIDLLEKAVGALTPLLSPVVSMITALWNITTNLFGAFMNAAGAVGDFVASLGPVQFIAEAISNALGVVGDVVHVAGDAVGWLNDRIGDIPGPWHRAADAVDVYVGAIAGAGKQMDDMVSKPAMLQVIPNFDALSGHAESHMNQPSVSPKLDMAFIHKQLREIRIDMHQQGRQADMTLADGIRQNRGAVDSAWSQILEDLKHPLSKAKEIGLMTGELASKSMLHALENGDPMIVDEAKGTIGLMVQEFATLKPKVGSLTKATIDNLEKMLHSKNADVRRAAQDMIGEIEGPLTGLPADMQRFGAAAGNAYAAGLRTTQSKVAGAVEWVTKPVRSAWEATSPPKDPSSPLHHIGDWGEATGSAWAERLARGAGKAAGMVNGVMSGISPGFDLAVDGGPSSGSRSDRHMTMDATIHLSGGAVTPGAGKEIAQQLGPVIVKWMQDNGILPRHGTGQRG